ncbi:MAG: hypothetical protein H6603_07105 [Flavobacteriales bacterium]|nr:hypothetical protein [Flavobacteriales bacterium]MCB9204733.1 hypothetical protein [Flavobacteriales bacterium]
MSFFNDLKEDAKLWDGASLITKIFLVTSLFFTVSSLASLSDVVVEWRGFFLDSLSFYRSYINGPLRKLGALVGLNYTRDAIDYLILSTIYLSAATRWSLLVIKDQTIDAHNKKFADGLLYTTIPCLVILPIISGVVEIQSGLDKNIYASIGLAYAMVIAYQTVFTKGSNKFKIAFLSWLPILFGLIIIGVAAAINVGFQTPVH